MSDEEQRMSDHGIYFGPGTTPEKVAESVERAKQQRRAEGRRASPNAVERERFFGRIAEDIKRAGGGS